MCKLLYTGTSTELGTQRNYRLHVHELKKRSSETGELLLMRYSCSYTCPLSMGLVKNCVLIKWCYFYWTGGSCEENKTKAADEKNHVTMVMLLEILLHVFLTGSSRYHSWIMGNVYPVCGTYQNIPHPHQSWSIWTSWIFMMSHGRMQD